MALTASQDQVEKRPDLYRKLRRNGRTRSRRLLRIPGRLTRTARQWTLHLPARWPWQHDFIRALNRIRALTALV